MSERCLTFEYGDGTAVGILHEPQAIRSDLGVVVVVGGPQYRVGSHRLFVLLARALAEAGYPVFRFDYLGMGDSSGSVRTFEFIGNDIREALNVFHREVPGIQATILLGLCDGASAALIYANQDPRVSGLLLANPWVRTEVGEARAFVRHYYVRRLLQRSFWRKVITGELHPTRSAAGLLGRLVRARGSTTGTNGEERSSGAGDFVDLMRRGLAAFSGPILVLLSGRDLTAKEFKDIRESSKPWNELIARPNVQWIEISDADHTFSASASLSAAIDATLTWLAGYRGA